MSEIVQSVPGWVHSLHIVDKEAKVNTLMVKEKIYQKDSEGNVTYRDNLKFINDPVRPVWVTKPGCRNHQFKKEFEYLTNLDRYNVPDSKVCQTAQSALDGRYSSYEPRLRNLCSSPFIYAADIEAGVFTRYKYQKQIEDLGGIPFKYTVGCLDIENEVRGEGRINAITFIHENEIFTTVLDDYMYIHDRDKGTKVKATREDALAAIKETVGPLLSEHKFKLTFAIHTNEVDMIKWIFKHIHEKKTDFIGIWNMRHDIPHMMYRLLKNDVLPETVMPHPDVPVNLRFVRYNDDKTKDLQHITDRWDWCEIPGHSQFVDAMCLYARIRKTSGRKSSYSLDAVSNEEVGKGKLKLGRITNHWYEQNYRFLPYIAYNINDCVLMQLMEWKNHDYSQLLSLSGVSMLNDFNKQTAMGKNSTFIYALGKGRVIASVGKDMLTPFDKDIPKLGGAVLSPARAKNIGSKILKEAPGIETQVVMSVNDLDVTAEYPSITATFNISKETKLSTALTIEGMPRSATEGFFSELPSPLENAVPLCSNYFGLPNYTKMGELFDQYVTILLKQKSDPLIADIDPLELLDIPLVLAK